MKTMDKKFGVLKSKILTKLTESYLNGDSKTMKSIISKINSNKDFKDVYLFYEEFENKTITDNKVSDMYISEVENMLRSKMASIDPLVKELSESLSTIETLSNPTYDLLDNLIEESTLSNIDSKIQCRMELQEFLSQPKEQVNESTTHTKNEQLLLTVLTNEFNNKFMDSLNESDKEELTSILNLSDEELKSQFQIMKEDTISKLNGILSEENDPEYVNKINEVKSELTDDSFEINKINYHKLKRLSKDL